MLSARGLARSLARSQLHARSFSSARLARDSAALGTCRLLYPAMAGTQDSAPGLSTHRRGGREGGNARRNRSGGGENEDGAISLGLARSGLRPMHMCHGGWRRARGKGYREEPADGVGNCARASQPLTQRTSERTASFFFVSDGPRMFLRPPQPSPSASLEGIADPRKLRDLL